MPYRGVPSGSRVLLKSRIRDPAVALLTLVSHTKSDLFKVDDYDLQARLDSLPR